MSYFFILKSNNFVADSVQAPAKLQVFFVAVQ